MFDQHSLVEAVGSAAAAITQASAAGSQEGVDDIRGIQDMDACTKRKEDSSSSNLGKSRRLLFRKDIRDKARMRHLVRQGK